MKVSSQKNVEVESVMIDRIALISTSKKKSEEKKNANTMNM